jgi:EmrB/QacA subfamily drug resistance transporter
LTQQVSESVDSPGDSQNPWIPFTAIGISLVTMVASMSMTSVALSDIADHFDVTLGSVAWVIIIQGLTITALMMPMGRLGDIIGRKKVHLAGLAMFAIGMVFTATAPSFGVLIGARIVSAIGNSMLQSVATGMTLSVFKSSDRGKALGMQTTMVAIGMATGPIVAGLILQFFSWQVIFWALLIPIGIAVVFSIKVLDEARVSRGMAAKKPPFDFVGAVVSAVVVVLAVILINNPLKMAVVSPLMIGGAVTAAVLFVFFIWWELRSDSPMLDLRMFSNRVMSIGLSARLFAFLGSSATFLLMPIYLISIRGFEEALVGGILFLSPVGVAIAAQLSGRLGDRFGTKPFLIIGYSATAIAAGAFAFVTADTQVWIVMIILFMSGVGMGTWNVTSNSVIMGAAPSAAMGVVGALTNLIRNVGTVIGQAVMTTVIVGVMISRDVDIPLSKVSESGEATLAYMAGWRIAFGIATVFILIALALSFAIKTRQDVEADESPPASGSVPAK